MIEENNDGLPGKALAAVKKHKVGVTIILVILALAIIWG